MNNLALKSLLILMFILFVSQNSDSTYVSLLIISGIGLIATLVFQYLKQNDKLKTENMIEEKE